MRRDSFDLILQKNGVYYCYKYCLKLFSKMRREIKFWYCRNCKKKYEKEET